ncbi:MAG: tripartite tricarboxylate transporter TctB family protein [Woeseiaceae bacterium]|nr:tripartite tricarboxylate transporter TctB family protein [Woeseiaceae bacterium]
MTSNSKARPGDVAIALALSLLAVALLVSAYSYSRASGIFPIFVGWIFLLLAVLELVLHARALSRQNPTTVSVDKAPSTLKRDIHGLLWLCAVVGLLFAVGFLVATPLFMFAFVWRGAKRSIYQSLAFATLATVFIYVVFVWLLNYHLYPGLLLAGLTQ